MNSIQAFIEMNYLFISFIFTDEGIIRSKVCFPQILIILMKMKDLVGSWGKHVRQNLNSGRDVIFVAPLAYGMESMGVVRAEERWVGLD